MGLAVGLAAGTGVGWALGRTRLAARLAASEAARAAERTADAEKRTLLETQFAQQRDAQNQTAQAQFDRLKAEFETLAEKILAEKTDVLQHAGKNQLDTVLTPFKERLDEFKKGVETSRVQSLELNTRLGEQIRALVESSRQLGSEAGNLARALKGDNKVQGDWGEVILDELLASSGLVEGRHYLKQTTLTDDGGRALRNEDSDAVMRPDVMVNYPDGKVVIVDSKVSLSAYVDYVNAETEEARAEALRLHIRSVRSHVDELVRKNYSAYVRKAQREAIDFVVMFMPNEPAHELAMRTDPNLWREAFERKVLIVSPVNLMALLQLIHLGWKRCDQERNQQRIAEYASQLLDRLYAFYAEYDALGAKLESAADAYRRSTDRLRGADGKRSVVQKAEQLKTLGVKMKKNMPLPTRLQAEDGRGENGDSDGDSDGDSAADTESTLLP